jgi:hypothetical protein
MALFRHSRFSPFRDQTRKRIDQVNQLSHEPHLLVFGIALFNSVFLYGLSFHMGF